MATTIVCFTTDFHKLREYMKKKEFSLLSIFQEDPKDSGVYVGDTYTHSTWAVDMLDESGMEEEGINFISIS